MISTSSLGRQGVLEVQYNLACKTACKPRFWCHDRPRCEKNGPGLDLLEAFSMRNHERMSVTQLYMIVLLVKRSKKYTSGLRDYASTAELVFIIGASLCPYYKY